MARVETRGALPDASLSTVSSNPLIVAAGPSVPSTITPAATPEDRAVVVPSPPAPKAAAEAPIADGEHSATAAPEAAVVASAPVIRDEDAATDPLRATGAPIALVAEGTSVLFTITPAATPAARAVVVSSPPAPKAAAEAPIADGEHLLPLHLKQP